MKKEYVKKEEVTVIPLHYLLGEEIHTEGFPGEFETFFEKLSMSNLFPTTSQPPAGDFLSEFNKALKEYDEIIAILLSSKLSGTYNSAILAKNMLGDKRITIVDSEQAASNLRFLVEDAIDMVKQGKEVKEIEECLKNKRHKMKIYVTTDTLEYLSRGGRLSSIQSTVGNLLNIKPIIELKDGELQLLEKVRGKNKAINTIIEKIPENVERISICHILNEGEADRVKSILEEKFPNTSISIDELGPVVGAHLGPKSIGVCFY
jgi:DegV family protein with EDD domain